jgi:glycosyltransferase involved in cell wall biosynthesis
MEKCILKVLFLTNIPSPYRVDFFNELGKRINLTVLFERKCADDRHVQWINKSSRTYNEVFLKGINIGKDSALCLNVVRYFKKNEYDLIVVGGYSTLTGMLAIEYLEMVNIPFLLNVDGGFIKKENKINFYIKRHYISKACAWLSPSISSDKYLIRYGAKKQFIYRFPFTSVREKNILKKILTDEERLNIRKKLNIKEKKIVISVGRFIYSKGYDLLIEAGKELNNETGIYIIGGKPTQEYKNLIEKYGIKNIHFIDFISSEELSNYYKAADVFVLPTRSDVWGLVINEAMAYGLPIVTTNMCVAGLELIDNGINGYVIQVNDKYMLINAINKILKNNELRRNMSISSLKKISKFTIESMAKRHLEIFSNFLSKKE